MREACYNCFLKHVAKAAVVEPEARLGYPDHVMYVIGNLSEAEDEIMAVDLQLASDTRDVRLKYTDDFNYNIDSACRALFNRGLAGRALAAMEKTLP